MVSRMEKLSKTISGEAMDQPVSSRYPAWLKIGAFTLGSFLLFAAVYGYFLPGGESTMRVKADQLAISEVTSGVFEDFIPARTRVAPLTTVYLDAVRGGRVEEVFVEAGDMVKEGDLLVRLANTGLQLEVLSSEAQIAEQLNNINSLELQLEQNRLNHKQNLVEINYQIKRLSSLVQRRRAMAERNLISQEEIETVEDELEYWKRRHDLTLEAQKTDILLQEVQLEQLRESSARLRENLSIARENLAALSVRAPIAGQLTAFDANPGQSLAPGERIGQIDDPDSYKLIALLDEFYLSRVDIAQEATVEVGGESYDLMVSNISPQVHGGQFELDLKFTGSIPENEIRRGQTLQSRIIVGGSSEIELIPSGAYYQQTGGNWVFVVAPDRSSAIRREVRLGRRNAEYIEVLDGLESGELVITSPYTAIANAQRIELQ